MEHGSHFPGLLKSIDIKFNMNLDDALIFHDFLVQARSSMEQHIGNILSNHPQWCASQDQKEKTNTHLDKASLQHSMICQMERAFRQKLEAEKLLKPEEKA